jgi:Tol biopolymer transport system component
MKALRATVLTAVLFVFAVAALSSTFAGGARAGSRLEGLADLPGRIVFGSNLSPAARILDGRVGASRLHGFSFDGRPRVDYSAGIGRLSDVSASISPDGRRIAFVRGDVETGSSEVWITNEDGSGAHRLLAPEPGESFLYVDYYPPRFNPPEWSPDGTHLAIDAVSTASCLPGYTKCATWYTVVVDLEGHRVRVTGGLNAAWSPDGKYVLLLAGLFSLEDPNTWEFVVERADGSEVPAFEPGKRPGACWLDGSWSPDASRLLLVEGGCGGVDRRLHVFRTSDWTEVATLDGCCGAWIPRSSRLAYVKSTKDKAALITVTADGSRPRPIPGTTDASWSPSGERLAYIRRAGRRRELVIAQGDGSDPRTIAAGSWGTAWVNGWSPDGRYLVIGMSQGGRTTFAVVRSSGGRVRVFHRDLEGAWPFFFGWTAGNRLLVVRGTSALYPGELWVMRPQGAGLRRLTLDGTGALDPTWSPDGTKIAFWRDIPRKGKRPEVLAVYVMPATGGAARRVVGGPAGSFATYPDWSPDGRRIVFSYWQDGVHQDLYTVTAEGRDLRRLTRTGHAVAPAWSPDGRTIVFSNNGRLSAIPAGGGKVRALGDETVTNSCEGADWSPDGTQLAAICAGRLLVLDAGGGAPRELVNGATSSPSWSPDGNWIVFETDGGVAVVNARGGTPTVIDLRGAEARDPDWSP